MLYYTIKPEFYDEWSDIVDDDTLPISRDFVLSVSADRGETVESVLDQLDPAPFAWYLVSARKHGDMFEQKMKAGSRSAAIREILSDWDALSPIDRRDTGDFYAIHAVAGTDGTVDLETSDDEITLQIKEPAQISLDNGRSWDSADDAIDEIEERGLWDAVVNVMEDDVREELHAAIAPCSDRLFLRSYLLLSGKDLVIG